MMQLGLNVDPAHGFRVAELMDSGASWVRVVLRPHQAELLVPWLDECGAHEIKRLGVVTGESIGRAGYARDIRRLRRLFGSRLEAWQIANEPDLEGAPSWPRSPSRLNRLLARAREALPDQFLVLAGMGSGNPQYLAELSAAKRRGTSPRPTGLDLDYVDAVAVHCYGVAVPGSPNPWGNPVVPADAVLAPFREAAPGKPLWVTEFGAKGPPSLAPDFWVEAERMAYLAALIRALEASGADKAFVFCWSDLMVPGFGLVDAAGNPKYSYSVFVGAAAPDDPPVVDLIDQLPATGRYQDRPLAGITGATIHYTATPPWLTVQQIAEAQLKRDAAPGVKFPAIAYTLVVPAEGSVVVCHELSARTWHSAARPGGVARNATHVGICYVGDTHPTAAQIGGLRAALRWVEDRLGRPLQEIEGHGDTYPTRCPGPYWEAWRHQLVRD